MITRICSKCGLPLPLDSFWSHPRGLYGKQSHCKECQKANKRKNHDPVRRRKGTLKYCYNLSWEDYNALLKSQNHLCAICKEFPKDGKFHVDHCHKTNRVRSLLCNLCNQALGSAKDSIDILKEMIAYLERHSLKDN